MQKSTKITVLLSLLAVLGAAPFFIVPEWARSMPLSYPLHRFLHLLGGMIFVGNIIVTGFWMFLASRTKDPTIIHFAAKTVDWADTFFTAPGAILLAFNGLFLSSAWGGIYGTHWLLGALFMFSCSGVIWVVLLIPAQHRLIELSRLAVETKGSLDGRFYRTANLWYVWGSAATLLPLFGMAMMVFRWPAG